MPSNTLQIGSSYGAMADLSTLFETNRDREPQPQPTNRPANVDCADGSRVKMGWLEQRWHWNVLSEAMWATLVGYANTTKYVRTRDNEGDYNVYTCIIVLPEEEPEHFAGRVLDADIILRNLVPYSVPPPP